MTLSNDILRAQYLLKVAYNVDSLEESSLDQNENLSLIFEQRMEIEEADSEEELFAIQMQVQTQYDEKLQELGACFEKQDIQAAKKNLEMTKYLDQMLHHIDEKRERLKQEW